MNATTNHCDRRRAYRYSPPLLMEPQLHVVHDGDRLPVIDVLDINARGARLCFALSRRARFTVGGEVRVVAQAPGLDGLVDICAQVVFSATRDDRVVAGFVFDRLPDVGERADGVFFSVFNRRIAERAEPTVVACLATPAVESCGPLEVINHSEHGIGFLVGAELDTALRGLAQLELALSRADEPGASSRVTAEVRHRVRHGDTVYYGCRFAAAA
jgi:hypothetical protein